MQRHFPILAGCTALALGVAQAAWAQEQKGFEPVDKDALNAGRVTVMAGGIDGLHDDYLTLAGDMASVLDQKGDLRILPIMGRGPIETIRDLLHLQGIDIGVVHSDVLAHLRESAALPAAGRRLRYIAKLKDEVFHVLTRGEISAIADLDGKPVIAGSAPSSGEAISAGTMLDLLGIKPQLSLADWDSAMSALRTGKVAAVIATGPAGMAAVRDLAPTEGLTLLSLPFEEKLSETYDPILLSAVQYPNLLGEGETVNSLRFGSVMAVYDWPSDSERFATVARFTQRLFDAREALRVRGRHPAWSDFDPVAEVPGWIRFAPAEAWLQTQPKLIAQEGALSNLKAAFLEFMDLESTEAGEKLRTEETDRLFKAFLNWTESPAEAVVPIRLANAKGLGNYVGTIGVRNIKVEIGDEQELALSLDARLSGLPPGPHALRIYENPSCAPGRENGESVPALGAGKPVYAVTAIGAGSNGSGRYLGDIPDLMVKADGTVERKIVVPRLSLADLFGRAIVIHASSLEESPRQACGVIE